MAAQLVHVISFVDDLEGRLAEFRGPSGARVSVSAPI